MGVSPELRRSVSYFASICSANVPIFAPNLAGVAGIREEGCAEGAGSCTAFRCSCPARPAEDHSDCRARRVFSCPAIDLYGRCWPDATAKVSGSENVLAKTEFVGYASGCPIRLGSRRLNWRRRGAAPLRQAYYSEGAANRRPGESPPLRWTGRGSQSGR